MILIELAFRHLLGGRFSVFLRHRWRRWATALLSLVAAVLLGVIIAFQGLPVWGAGMLVGMLAALSLLRRFIHAPIPESARGAYASAVSLIAVLGIALAVMTLIVVISVMDGFTFDIQRALLRTTPHVRVTTFDERCDPGVVASIAAVEGVRHADPFIENEVLLNIAGFQRPIPVLLRGEEPARHGRGDGPELMSGDWSALGDTGKVVIGEELARTYYLGVGDHVRLITPGVGTDGFGVPRIVEVEIAGTFRTGFYEVDEGMIIMGLGAAGDFLGMGGLITGVAVTGRDLFEAEELSGRIGRELPFPVVALSWARLRKNMYEAMKTEKYAMFVIETFLILIASFNVTSTLFMAVGRKTREIAVLMAMGMTRRGVLALFALEGFLLGATGTALGVGIGTGFALYLKHFPIRMPGGGSVYYIDTIPVHVSYELIAAASVSALVLALLASIYPAWTASRLSPARALRFE